MDFKIGSEYGEFKFIGRLGSGGQGTVYKVSDGSSTLALKVLNGTVDDETRLRFRTEYNILSDVDHPSLCRVEKIGIIVELGETGFIYHDYIAMEYIEGVTLASKLQRNDTSSWYEHLGVLTQDSASFSTSADATTHILSRDVPLITFTSKPIEDFKKALLWTIHLCHTLKYVHSKGIIHRDIKPGNIMIDKDEDPRILDFGLAFLPKTTRLTRGYGVVGSPFYMSPEQTLSTYPVDHRTDIFSLGVTLYEMLTGIRPFQGRSARDVMFSIRNNNPKPVTSLRDHMPSGIDNVIRKALAKFPEDRYPSVEKFLEDLVKLL